MAVPLYLLAARLGQQAQLLQADLRIALIWPAAGVGAALVLALPRALVLPAGGLILLLNLGVNLYQWGVTAQVLLLAALNTLEPLLLRQFLESLSSSPLLGGARGRKSHDSAAPPPVALSQDPLSIHGLRPSMAFGLATLGAVLTTAILAGAGRQVLGMSTTWEFGVLWFKIHTVGLIVVTPLLLAIARWDWRQPLDQRAFFEGLAALGVACSLTAFMMLHRPPVSLATAILPLAGMFPVLLWVALRKLDLAGRAIPALFTLIAVAGTVAGYGPFADPNVPIPDEVLALHSTILVLSLCSFALLAIQAERARVETRTQALAAILHEFPDLVAMADAEGRLIWTNRVGTRLLPRHADGRPLTLEDLTSPAERAGIAAGLSEAREIGLSRRPGTLPGHDGREIPVERVLQRLPQMPGAAEDAPRFAAVLIDQSEIRAAEAQLKLLLGELSHRVKNNLAVVQSIATQTLRHTGTDSTRFVPLFLARLQALARGHELLTRTAWQPALLEDLAAQALAPFRSSPERILVQGPRIRVSPDIVLSMTLALHELATNGVKYGALSQPSGLVRLAWDVQSLGAETVLTMSWTETGGPPVAEAPAQTGFGTRLLQTLQRELDGTVSFDWRREGLVWSVTLPLSARIMLEDSVRPLRAG